MTQKKMEVIKDKHLEGNEVAEKDSESEGYKERGNSREKKNYCESVIKCFASFSVSRFVSVLDKIQRDEGHAMFAWTSCQISVEMLLLLLDDLGEYFAHPSEDEGKVGCNWQRIETMNKKLP